MRFPSLSLWFVFCVHALAVCSVHAQQSTLSRSVTCSNLAELSLILDEQSRNNPLFGQKLVLAECIAHRHEVKSTSTGLNPRALESPNIGNAKGMWAVVDNRREAPRVTIAQLNDSMAVALRGAEALGIRSSVIATSQTLSLYEDILVEDKTWPLNTVMNREDASRQYTCDEALEFLRMRYSFTIVDSEKDGRGPLCHCGDTVLWKGTTRPVTLRQFLLEVFYQAHSCPSDNPYAKSADVIAILAQKDAKGNWAPYMSRRMRDILPR